jgi:hypothetical protein
MVADGATGVFFAPGDAADLPVRLAWADAGDLVVMGTRAHREYESRYAPEANDPRLMEIYRRATSARAAGVGTYAGEGKTVR